MFLGTLEAGGKPSTWLPPGELVKHSFLQAQVWSLGLLVPRGLPSAETSRPLQAPPRTLRSPNYSETNQPSHPTNAFPRNHSIAILGHRKPFQWNLKRTNHSSERSQLTQTATIVPRNRSEEIAHGTTHLGNFKRELLAVLLSKTRIF